MGKKEIDNSTKKTLIRWLVTGSIIIIVCITLLILSFKPYEIRFSADNNIKESINSISEAYSESKTVIKQPIILDEQHFRDYCSTQGKPNVIACVDGCNAFHKNEIEWLCEGTHCTRDNMLNCNEYCNDIYLK